MVVLSLLQNFVTAPQSSRPEQWIWLDTLALAVLLAFGVLWLVGNLLRGVRRTRSPVQRRRPPVRKQRPSTRRARQAPKPAILIDGSNVIYWQNNTPQLEPLRQVVQDLSRQGLKPGVVFDANVGYKLTGQYLGEGDLSRLLSLPRDQIFVVPKGTQADPYLLETARDLKAQIVTNDRYRDWVDTYPEVAKPGTLIRGGLSDGKVWLKGLEGGPGSAR